MENFFETLIPQEEYICGNKFISLENDRIHFCKTDFLDNIESDVETLITHNSDYNIDKYRYNLAPYFKKWFAQNKCISDENIFGLPIGLENYLIVESKNEHRQCIPNRFSIPKKQFLSSVSKNENEHKNLLYLNFNTNTNKTEREKTLEYFSTQKWLLKKNKISFEEYYKDISNSKFVLSPDGNGVDCHRTWEALYLRSIPIVKKSVCMKEFEELPILFVDDFCTITENFLEQKYGEMYKKQYNLDKLKMSYWRKKINESL